MRAQLTLPDVVEGEYFFDVDPGYGHASSITFSQSNTLNLNQLFTLNSFTNGYHFLGIRFKDSDENWGMTYTHSFAVDNSTMIDSLPDITAIEYFFDTDSGFSIQPSIVLTPDSILNLNNIFNLSALTNGIHSLGIRAKDTYNNWSQTFHYSFAVDNYSIVNELPNITEFEYFFNTEPGIGNAAMVALPPDTLWDFSHIFDLDTLPLGNNFLGIRAINANAQFGHTFIHSFTKLEPPVLYNLTGGGSYCEGSTGLSAILDDSESGVFYILFKDSIEFDTLVGTDTNLVWNNLTTGTYTVNGYFANTPHIYELMNDTVFITENPLPIVSISGLDTIYCVYHPDVSMTGTPSGGTFSGQGVSGNSFDPAMAGLGTWNIIYNYSDTNGCNNADTIIVEVDVCSGIPTDNFSHFSLYPNPTSGLFYIDMGFVCKSGQIKITDIFGRLIFEKNIENKQFLNINIDIPNGVYFVEILFEKEKRVVKLIKG